MPRKSRTPPYLSHRMVVQRCMRLYRHNQWRMLYEFCVMDPRARAWTRQRISELGDPRLLDAKVQELATRLQHAFGAHQPAPVTEDPAAQTPTTEVQQQDVWLDVDMTSLEVRPSGSVATPDPDTHSDTPSIEFARPALAGEEAAAAQGALPAPFLEARARGETMVAAQALLRWLHSVPPGVIPRLKPVEFRELAVQLAEAGALGLFMELCGRLPQRVTASAVQDVAEMVRLGARIREPLTYFMQATEALATEDSAGMAQLQQMLLSAVQNAAGD